MIKMFRQIVAPLFALFFALSIMIPNVWASTTATDLQVVTDRDSVSLGSSVNISMNVLNSAGGAAVDAETQGATVRILVQSTLGYPQDGTAVVSTEPGLAGKYSETTSDTNNIIAYNMQNGSAGCSIYYPSDGSAGTDSVTITLQTIEQKEQGGTLVDTIATRSFNMVVNEAASTATDLRIVGFTSSSADTQGDARLDASTAFDESNDDVSLDPTDAANYDKVIHGQITAGKAGSQVVVKAYKSVQYDANAGDQIKWVGAVANGTVTLTLVGAGSEDTGKNSAYGTTYTFTGTMINGLSTITFDTSIIIAGVYNMIATMQTDETTTIDSKWPINDRSAGINSDLAIHRDRLQVLPTTAAKVRISTNKTKIAAKETNLKIQAELIDKYGNRTKAPSNDTKIKVAASGGTGFDSNTEVTIPAFVSRSAAPINNGAISDPVIKNITSLTVGTVTLVGSVYPASTAIADSDSLTVEVKSQGLVAGGTFNSALTAGTLVDTTDNNPANDGLRVWINSLVTSSSSTTEAVDDAGSDGVDAGPTDDDLLSDGTSLTLEIWGLSSGKLKKFETQTSAVDDHGRVDFRFNSALTASADNSILIYDTSGNYGQYSLTFEQAINAATKGVLSVAFKDAYSAAISSFTSVANSSGGTTYLVIDPQQFSVTDSSGNSITTGSAGTVTVSSANGTVTNGTVAIGYNSTDNNVIVEYSSTTTTDTLSFAFTTPGLSVSDMSVSIPGGINEIVGISVASSAASIPVGGETLLTITGLDVDGAKTATDAGSGNQLFIDIPSGIYVKKADRKTPVSTSEGLIGSTSGVQYLMVKAGTAAGTYMIAVSNAANTVIETIDITVENAVSSSIDASSKNLNLSADGESVISITGGSSPYYISTDPDSSIATAVMEDSVVTVNAVATGSTSVTISDSAGATVTISITVGTSVETEPQPVPTEPTPDGEWELTDDEIAAAPVNMGSVTDGKVDNMQLSLNFPPYEGAVDIYVLLAIPTDAGFAYFSVKPDGSLVDALGEEGIVAYEIATTDAVNTTVFESFTVCTPFGPAVNEGQWYVFYLIAPTNGGDSTTALDGPHTLKFFGYIVSCE